VTTAAIAAALAAGSGCGRTETPPPAPSAPTAAASVAAGQTRMVAALADVARRTPMENPILGERLTRELRGRAAATPPDAPPSTRIPLHVQLGGEELRIGNTGRAIQHLTEARRLLGEMERGRGVRPDLVFNASYMLGVAHLRRAETENCCAARHAESCLLPIRGGGVHARPDGSRDAMRWFTDVLRRAPGDSDVALKSRWLLNLAAMTVGAHPDAVPAGLRIPTEVFESAVPFPRFPNVAPGLGLDDFDLAGGVVADDLDGDGDVDLLVSTWDPNEPLRLHLNAGDGTFTRRAPARANLDGITGGFNLAPADYDDDGDVDVLVLRGAWLGPAGRIPNSLLRNEGDATFTDVTFETGLGDEHRPTQTAAWADYDSDGDLDLYVGNESQPGHEAPCRLFRNDVDTGGVFTDVTAAAGVGHVGLTKSVAWGDYDDDGHADLYVSSLGQANRLYRNRGDGTFTDVAPALGVDGPRLSFVAWFWDFDADGVLDLFVSSYDWIEGGLAAVARSRLGRPSAGAAPRLYRGDGRGGFADVAVERGLGATHLPMGANFGDLDGDGFPDVYLGTGYPDYEALMPNVMYRNDGGERFHDVTFAGGFGHLQKGHGIAFADLDHDGDLDVFAQMGGFFPGDRFGNALFRNPGFGHHWLAVDLEGVRSNRSAIGARLAVEVVDADGGRRTIHRRVSRGGSFGANPRRQTVGLGEAAAIERITVRWPATGAEQVFERPPLDRLVRIVEGAETLTVVR
jgi:hypothetical protein